MIYGSETRIASLYRIRRERVLPRPGEVLVDPGDRVESSQIVGRTTLPGDFRIVPVGRLLGVSTSDVAKHLRVDLGGAVHRGDVLAKREGLIGPTVTAPIDGVLTATGGGRVLIEAKPTPFELRAHLTGTVLSVERDQVIGLETAGTLIQGMWGTVGESVGTLKCLTRRPTEPLQVQAVDPACRGTIVVAGVTLDEESIARVHAVDARGLITGGLAPELISVARKLDFPVIVTDGFGEIAMMERIFDLLTEHDGRETSIDGGLAMARDPIRPEIIIPIPNREPPPERSSRHTDLEPGTEVRAIRAPYAGQVGTVVSMPRYAQRLETGARIRCAEIDFGGDGSAFIPLVNLDILR